MAIDVTEMQRLAGVVPSDDGYHSYREAVGLEVLDEDMASGARGWLSGVKKAVATWTDKLTKSGASTSQIAALKVLDQAVSNAMSKLGEGAPEDGDVLAEEDVPAYEKGGDLVAFNAALAKMMSKLKKALGAQHVKAGYKGTGSKSYKRQIFMRLADDSAVDVWLDYGFAEIGGVMSLPGVDRSPIKYAGKTPADVYDEILKRLQAAQNKAKATEALNYSGAASVLAEALKTTHDDDIFGDHRNWARVLADGTVLSEGTGADKLRKLMILGLWKKLSKQLAGTGYARIEDKKHVVRVQANGMPGGDPIALSKGKDVTLEDLGDADLEEMFVKAAPWLAKFEGAWVQKNLDVLKAVLPAQDGG
jgi:hypothetical protein